MITSSKEALIFSKFFFFQFDPFFTVFIFVKFFILTPKTNKDFIHLSFIWSLSVAALSIGGHRESPNEIGCLGPTGRTERVDLAIF